MKSFLKFLFYSIFCPILLFAGVDRFFRRVSKNRRLIIMYHGVTGNDYTSINGRHLSTEGFERQLRYFRKNFNVIPLTDLCEMQARGIIPEKHTIALTFDDGYVNNISDALPLLKKYEIPATFFISSISLENPDYIHPSDYLDMINFSVSDRVEINGKIFKKGKYHLVSVENGGASVYGYVNELPLPLLVKTLSQLRLQYPPETITRGVQEGVYRLITRSLLHSLISSDLVAIGSHGHLHVNLTMLLREEIKNQLVTSRQIFARYTGRLIETFAFPYGYFDEEVLSLSREVGYKYLIAGGQVESKYKGLVFPRIGILNLASFAYNMLAINRGFRRFGF
jgi:peptidoglycan/xylan/chitin deacetylase (PgdA/CDA1 family)